MPQQNQLHRHCEGAFQRSVLATEAISTRCVRTFQRSVLATEAIST